jgi:hypothetical protein
LALQDAAERFGLPFRVVASSVPAALGHLPDMLLAVLPTTVPGHVAPSRLESREAALQAPWRPGDDESLRVKTRGRALSRAQHRAIRNRATFYD